jgi:hypothetical protein
MAGLASRSRSHGRTRAHPANSASPTRQIASAALFIILIVGTPERSLASVRTFANIEPAQSVMHAAPFTVLDAGSF